MGHNWFSQQEQTIQALLIFLAAIAGILLVVGAIIAPIVAASILVSIVGICGITWWMIYLKRDSGTNLRADIMHHKRKRDSRDKRRQDRLHAKMRRIEEQKEFEQKHMCCQTCEEWVLKTEEVCPHCGRPFTDSEALSEFLLKRHQLDLREKEIELQFEKFMSKRGMPRGRRGFQRELDRYQPENSESVAVTMAILGFALTPIFSVVALAMGKPGGTARTLGWIGIVLWCVGLMLFMGIVLS